MDKRKPSQGYARRSTAAGRPASGARQRPQPVRTGTDARYDGRFGSAADAGSRRPTGSYRSQPSGGYRSRMDYEHRRSSESRPSMHSAGDSYTRRPAPKQPKAGKERKPKSRKKIGAVIAVVAVLLLAVFIVAAIGNRGPVHQLPTVERGNAILTEDL